MGQADKAIAFADLHRAEAPLLLYNIWDAGSAKAVARAGVTALATGSASVARAHGYEDAEGLPLELALANAERICAAVDLPVSIDFEGAYAVEPEAAAANVARLIETGAVGCNFEDQVIGGEGRHAINAQAARIAAIRAAADDAGVAFFINARTDVFLQEKNADRHADLMSEALERASAYVEAGASGIFVPLLGAPDLIARFCEACPLPVNVMARDEPEMIAATARTGAARISLGPFPFSGLMEELTRRAETALRARQTSG